ncbi:hypothetical protein J2S11_000745 [Bacillus horti]|uniref:Transposase n=1 Tax=Caldalkalibacillus horti TaxID=77523 RepID=A0ABT9VV33_9BACI|nr:hypothetical protein [Bacillus horti]
MKSIQITADVYVHITKKIDTANGKLRKLCRQDFGVK